jgi:integrase
MALWKRGRRYWTHFVINGIHFRKPLRPPGASLATTNWQAATRLEKQLIEAAQNGRLEPRSGPSRLFEAADAYIAAKSATANTKRAVEFDKERLEVLKKHFGDVRLALISREMIEGFQRGRRDAGAGNRTVNMDVGVLRQVLKRFGHWRRLEDHVQMLSEAKAPVGRALTPDEQKRLFEKATTNPEWEHVYCAAVLAANTSMRGVEIKHLRRRDVDVEKSVLYIRKSKNESSHRILPLNGPAKAAIERMLARADSLGHTEPDHYLWPASQWHRFDPTQPASKWDTAWRTLRDAAGLPGLRFHDLRHTVITELLEAGEADHVVESISGHLSRRMLEHYSHIRIDAKKRALDRLDESRKTARGEL